MIAILQNTLLAESTLPRDEYHPWTSLTENEKNREVRNSIEVPVPQIQEYWMQQAKNQVTVQNPIPDQQINIYRPYPNPPASPYTPAIFYSYSLNEVFSGNYTLLSAATTGQSNLPNWLSLQYQLASNYTIANTNLLTEIEALGNIVFVATAEVLLIFNVSMPSAPQLLTKYPINAYSIAMSGNKLLVAAYNQGLIILDISIPGTPQVLGNYSTPNRNCFRVKALGDTAFLMDGVGFQCLNRRLLILDISTPSSPHLLGYYYDETAFQMALFNDIVFLLDGNSALVILNVSEPSSPQLVRNYSIAGELGGMSVLGNILFIANGFNGLLIFDISTPGIPQLLGRYETPGWARGVAGLGNTVFVIDSFTVLTILDISKPSKPQLLGSYNKRGVFNNGWKAVAVSSNLVFVTDYDDGLLVIDVSQGQLLSVISLGRIR